MFRNIKRNLKSILDRNSRLYYSNKTSNDSNENIEIPPEPTNCCMSGCANCVWIEYAETLMKLFKDGGDKARNLILEKIQDPNMKAYISTELKTLERMKQYEAENKGKPNITKDPLP